MNDETSAGITVVRCKPDGTVTEVLVNQLGLAQPVTDQSGHDERRSVGTAALFTAWCRRDSIGAGLVLVREASLGQLLVPIRLQLVDRNGTTHNVSAIGAPDGDTALIVAAARRAALSDAVKALEGTVTHQVIAQLSRQIQNDDLVNDLVDNPQGIQELSPVGGDAQLVPALDAMSRTNNELMDLHRALVAANARLTAHERTRDRMLAMVAHDLRSPLGVMKGMADTLLARFNDQLDPKARQLVERIAATGERTMDLVAELVEGARTLSTELTIRLAEHDLGELVAEVVDRYRQPAANKQILLVFEPPSEPLPARIDDDRIVQVLDNLLSNAVKFTPAGHNRTVTVTMAKSPGNDRREATIAVADEGPGLTDDDQLVLWQPFARASARPTAGEPSSGLGLPIARRIVEAHGGHIEATTTPGSGAVFTVRLPI